ncbi:hypothetical protein L1887_49070 [Cichorium endivia]|nr:hypothetical protein L1887_49070 [Cichorium endivia]
MRSPVSCSGDATESEMLERLLRSDGTSYTLACGPMLGSRSSEVESSKGYLKSDAFAGSGREKPKTDACTRRCGVARPKGPAKIGIDRNQQLFAREGNAECCSVQRVPERFTATATAQQPQDDAVKAGN